jgi:lysyl-tRNA synthetase class 2
MALSDQEQQRLQKLEWIREQGIDPFPPRCERMHTAQQAVAAFAQAEAEGSELTVSVAGRLHSFRDMGKSIFAHIEDETGQIQIYLRRDEVDETSFELFKRYSDLGDFYAFTGPVFRTRSAPNRCSSSPRRSRPSPLRRKKKASALVPLPTARRAIASAMPTWQ